MMINQVDEDVSDVAWCAVKVVGATRTGLAEPEGGFECGVLE
jgi:hypothetical protein